MPGITGMGTTYNLPNFVGPLFNASPTDTPLLSMIGGLTGGMSVKAPFFEWQGYDLRDPDDSRQRVEGSDAPAAENRVRYNASNVLEIHQETVDVSYTKQAATGMRSTGGADTVTIGDTVIPADELNWQLEQQFRQIARDVEKTFITGKYQKPTDNTQPRRTRGLLEAIETHRETTNLTAETLTADRILDLFQNIWEDGGIQESETRTVIVSGTLKRALTRIFITDKNYEEQSRNVGGVDLTTFETDFGRCNIMLDRYMPADTLVVASIEELSPAFLEIPGKGHFFAEPLAKTGASDRLQIYGEIGLAYGNERTHGSLQVGVTDSKAKAASK